MSTKNRARIIHISGSLLVLFMLFGFFHKFYVSISQIDVNRDDKTLEISLRIFTNDFEDAIYKEFKKKLLLGSKKENPKAREIISNYLLKHLIITQSSEKAIMKFIGFELEKDIIWLYLEAPLMLDRKDITIRNDLIMDLYEDQKNIVNLRASKKTRSQICTKSNPVHTFKLEP